MYPQRAKLVAVSREYKKPSPKATAEARPRRNRHHGRGEATLADLVLRVYPSKKPDDTQLVAAHARWHITQSKLVRQNARPSRLRDGVLFVACTTSSWAQELTFRSEAIMKSLVSDPHLAQVHSLRFTVGKVTPLAEPEIALKPPSYVHIPENVARAIAEVRDADLQHAIAGAAAAIFDEADLTPMPKRLR